MCAPNELIRKPLYLILSPLCLSLTINANCPICRPIPDPLLQSKLSGRQNIVLTKHSMFKTLSKLSISSLHCLQNETWHECLRPSLTMGPSVLDSNPFWEQFWSLCTWRKVSSEGQGLHFPPAWKVISMLIAYTLKILLTIKFSLQNLSHFLANNK